MSNFFNIIRKEIKELLTPATIFPVIIMAIIFGSMGSAISGIEDEAQAKPVIGLINEDTEGMYSSLATTIVNQGAKVVYNGTNIDQGLKLVKSKDGSALLIITGNFSENIAQDKPGVIEIRWVMEGAGVMDSISSAAVEGLLQSLSRSISTRLISQNTSVNATVALNPVMRNETTMFKDKELKGLSPGVVSGMLSSQSVIIPIIMMMIILMAGGQVISSMGMEKENKTLETLLTLPVKRSAIVAGKLAGSALVGLILAVVFMIGFSSYMQSFQMGAQIDLAQYGLTLGSMDYLMVGISVFIALLAGLSLCMVLGTFAKNYKSAQMLTMPVSFLAIVPMFVIMFKDFSTLPLVLKGVVFAIPFSHPMMAMRNLMFDEYLLVIGGIIYVALFSIVTIAIAIWIFNTDRLLTGAFNFKGFAQGKQTIWRKLFRR